jgi:hypothetical protein
MYFLIMKNLKDSVDLVADGLDVPADKLQRFISIQVGDYMFE